MKTYWSSLLAPAILIKPFIYLTLFFCVTGVGFSADWSQWGGTPSRNMVATGVGKLPSWFSPGVTDSQGDIALGTTANVRWVVQTGSKSVFTSPVVSQGRIILGVSGNILCYDMAAGALLWRYPKIVNSAGFGFCSTATIEGDRVYVVDPAGVLLCLDLFSEKKGVKDDRTYEGKVLWSYDTKKLGLNLHYSACSSPLLIGDYIYVGTSNARLMESNKKTFFPLTPSLVAFNKHTGQLVARDDEQIGARVTRSAWSSPSCGVVNGKTQIYFGGGDGICYAFEPMDPTAKVNSDQLITTKLHRQLDQFIRLDRKASPADILAAKAAILDDMKKVAQTTGIPPGQVHWAGPSAPMGSTDIEARVPDVPCLKKIWSVDCNPKEYREDSNGVPRLCDNYSCPDSPGEIIATPVFYQNKVYVAIGEDPTFGPGRGNLVCIDATRKGDFNSGQWLWNYKDMGRSISTVSIADGLVYACDGNSTVHCLDAETGKKYWEYKCLDAETGNNNHCWASTMVADGKVFVATRKGLFILATGRESKLLGKVKLPEDCHATPCAVDKMLFVCAHKHLWAVEDKGVVAPAP